MDSQTRQEYVRAAIGFLQNPKLVDSPLKDKLKFLKDKGLSDVEVDEALNLALVNRHQSQSSKFNFLLVLGLCVGGYKLYQAYLESKQKQPNQGSNKDPRQQDDQPTFKAQLDSLNPHSNTSHPTLDELLQKINELKKLIDLQRHNFGQEMQSLKTLLLGHEKFAAPPVIPAWQLGESEPKVDVESGVGESVSINNDIPEEEESTSKDSNKSKKKRGNKANSHE